MNHSLLKNSIPDRSVKIRGLDNTYERMQNSINTLSFNLSKSNNKRENNLIEDCSVFVFSQKEKEILNVVETQIQEEKSLKLADLTSYEFLKKNSFLESNNNYKFSDSESYKSHLNNDDVFKNN